MPWLRVRRWRPSGAQRSVATAAGGGPSLAAAGGDGRSTARLTVFVFCVFFFVCFFCSVVVIHGRLNVFNYYKFWVFAKFCFWVL